MITFRLGSISIRNGKKNRHGNLLTLLKWHRNKILRFIRRVYYRTNFLGFAQFDTTLLLEWHDDVVHIHWHVKCAWENGYGLTTLIDIIVTMQNSFVIHILTYFVHCCDSSKSAFFSWFFTMQCQMINESYRSLEWLPFFA